MVNTQDSEARKLKRKSTPKNFALPSSFTVSSKAWDVFAPAPATAETCAIHKEARYRRY